ncbi:MAG: T9SS type A sorting domain-containing protein [bacterium]
MKKLTVIFFLICSAFGQWQQSDEIALPKGIQVNDLVINNLGELWVLSASSILKYERAAKKPFLIREIANSKALTVIDEVVYVIDNSNQLLSLDFTKSGLITSGNLVFNSPTQITHVKLDHKPIFIIREPGRLVFTDCENLLGFISANTEHFSILPTADYEDVNTPLFTLANNRIYAWTGGTVNNPANYRKKVLYSASHKILDFSTDKNGNLFVLFSDSVVVLDIDGSYKNKVNIHNVAPGSKILTTLSNNNVVVYNQAHKSLKTLAGIEPNRTDDIITLKNNYPNPVDNYTEIEFSIGQFLDLTITVYNLIGEPIKVIAKGRFPKGAHKIVWHAVDERGSLVPNGIYFYRLESKKGVAIKQLTVLR